MPSAKKTPSKPILCLDFDGVLHWYRQGWKGHDIIDDLPVPGAVEFVTRARQVFSIMVYSSRSSYPGGIEAMRNWMEKYGFPEVKFATQKPAAFLTIDDRALLFTGEWPDPQLLRNFKPWTREAFQKTNPNFVDIIEETNMLSELVRKSRSVRRFEQNQTVAMETLRSLVDMARLAPSGANFQPLKYYISNEPEKNAVIFNLLAWAGYLRDWPGPEQGERPAAYIIVLGDSTINKSFGCDHGIAAQTIMLGAAEKGLGGCIIGSIKRAELSAALRIPPQYEILLVLALGQPKEEVVIEPLPEGGSVHYWRDEQRVHHVPKRALDDVIIK